MDSVRFAEAQVEVFSSEACVSRGGLRFEDTLVDRQHGHVERASTKVKGKGVLLLFLVLLPIEAVGYRRNGSCVDDALQFQACNHALLMRTFTMGLSSASLVIVYGSSFASLCT